MEALVTNQTAVCGIASGRHVARYESAYQPIEMHLLAIVLTFRCVSLDRTSFEQFVWPVLNLISSDCWLLKS